MTMQSRYDGSRKIYPGGVEAVKGIDFEVARRRGVRPARAQRRRQVDDGRDADDDDRPDERERAARPVTTSRASRCAARSVSSVVFQEPVVDASLSGRANLELHARLWGVSPAQEPSGGSTSSSSVRAWRS